MDGVWIFVRSFWLARSTTETWIPPFATHASSPGPAEVGRMPNGPVVLGTTTWLMMAPVVRSTRRMLSPPPSR
jgi:hypothetical protein